MAIPYCNTTTDLTDIFPDIELLHHRRKLDGFKTVPVYSNTYKIHGCGQINMIFDDGIMLTSRATIILVNTNAGSFYYDSANDVLYVHAIDSDNLITANILIESGDDWTTIKIRQRNKAMEFLDSSFNKYYPTPLQPRLAKIHVSDSNFEYPVVRACALQTCILLLERNDPDHPIINSIRKQLWNPDPEPGEQKGLMDKIINGDIVLQEQISAREAGSFNVISKSDNTITAFAYFLGKYTGSKKLNIRIQIDTLGTVGTATFKWSNDGGITWKKTLQKTYDVNTLTPRQYIAYGIYVEFLGTFGLGDYWDLECFPFEDQELVRSTFGSIVMGK